MQTPDQYELAIMRTQLANERTLLAYLRTCLGFLATAAAIYRFYTSPNAAAIAIGFAAISVVTMTFGVRSFLRAKQEMRHPRS
jgi:putative membrane protein